MLLYKGLMSASMSSNWGQISQLQTCRLRGFV